MTHTPRDLLTVGEVAAELRVDPATVRRWITAGRLEATKPGKDYRVTPQALDALLARTRTRPLTVTTTSEQVLT